MKKEFETYTPDLLLKRSKSNIGLPKLRIHGSGYEKHSACSGRFGVKIKKSSGTSSMKSDGSH